MGGTQTPVQSHPTLKEPDRGLTSVLVRWATEPTQGLLPPDRGSVPRERVPCALVAALGVARSSAVPPVLASTGPSGTSSLYSRRWRALHWPAEVTSTPVLSSQCRPYRVMFLVGYCSVLREHFVEVFKAKGSGCRDSGEASSCTAVVFGERGVSCMWRKSWKGFCTSTLPWLTWKIKTHRNGQG